MKPTREAHSFRSREFTCKARESWFKHVLFHSIKQLPTTDSMHKERINGCNVLEIAMGLILGDDGMNERAKSPL